MRKPAIVAGSTTLDGACHVSRAVRVETVVVASAVPDPPPQLKLNVVSEVMGPVVTEPDVGLLPLQPPEPVHCVAPVLDQLSVVGAPGASHIGVAVSDAVTGVGVGAATGGGLVGAGGLSATVGAEILTIT